MNFGISPQKISLHELSKAQDVLKQETGKLSTELQELTKTLQPTINQLTTAQSTNNNNNNNNKNNNYNKNKQQNWNKNNGPRGNNPQNWKNNQQNWRNNNNQQNWRPPNPNWQNQRPNWNQQRNTAQSSQKYCNYCNKFGHILSQCWFRPQHHPPALPYTPYSAQNFTVQQPMMPPQSMVATTQMPTYWTPHYDANQQASNPKN